MLNPFEVAVFSIFLDRLEWKEHGLSPHFTLIYVGMLAKEYLGSQLCHIQEHFAKRVSNFKEQFENWRENVVSIMNVSLVDINERFKSLNTEGFEGVINYNYYVDEILQISPPYQIEARDGARGVKKEKKEEAKEEGEEDKGLAIGFQISPIKMKAEETTENTAYEKLNSACSAFLTTIKLKEIQVPDIKMDHQKNSILLRLTQQ
jgi:hypothetical protein